MGAETVPYLKWLNLLYLREERKNESLGFVPYQAYERDAPKGRIWIALLDGEAVGFIYGGAFAPNKDARIHQACIDFDLRRRQWGTAMVGEFMKSAQAAHSTGIVLRCGFDVEANDFWADMGFYVCAYTAGGLRRGRTINVWRSDFVTPLIPHARLVPARGQRDATLWNRYKDKLDLKDVTRPSATWEQLLPILEPKP